MPKIRPRPDLARTTKGETFVIEHTCEGCGKKSLIEVVEEAKSFALYVGVENDKMTEGFRTSKPVPNFNPRRVA